MKENLKDILGHLSTEVNQETLLLYLQGRLSAEKQHEVEKALLENEFAAEALEGLQHIKDQKKVQLLVDQLNRDLKNKTAKKKVFKEKMRLKTEPWLLTGIIILLLLIVLAYFVIFLFLRQP